MPASQLPARRNGFEAGELRPLADDLEPEVRAFALQLRELFEMLHISLSQYALLHYRDKGALSRYLSGVRIPERPFLDELLREFVPVTEEVRAHLYELHLRALEARDKRAYRVQMVTDQLAEAATELKHTRLHVQDLEQALAAREQEISDLTMRLGQMERAWMTERDRSEEELARSRIIQNQLTEQRDALLAEAADIQRQMSWAESRREAAEARCALLQQTLESGKDTNLRQDSIAAPVLVPAIWGNVPPRNHGFIAREAVMDRIAAMRDQDPGRKQPIALVGMFGSGKTELALEYAYLNRSEYDLVWWIPAEELALVRSSLAALAGRLGLDVGSQGIEGAAVAVMDALRRGDPYSRWLLIYDNADQPEDFLGHILFEGPGTS